MRIAIYMRECDNIWFIASPPSARRRWGINCYDLTNYLARYRNVTICARVQDALGLNAVALVPVVIP